MPKMARIYSRNSCHVRVSVIMQHADFFFRGVVYNVSEQGLYLESGYPAKKSRKVYIRLATKKTTSRYDALTKGKIYTGEVVWSRNLVYSLTADYGIGIRLLACGNTC